MFFWITWRFFRAWEMADAEKIRGFFALFSSFESALEVFVLIFFVIYLFFELKK